MLAPGGILVLAPGDVVVLGPGDVLVTSLLCSTHLSRLGDAPFALVVNLMIPGPPFLSLVFVWGAEIDPESMPAEADSQSVATSVVGDSDEDELSLLSPVDRALAR